MKVRLWGLGFIGFRLAWFESFGAALWGFSPGFWVLDRGFKKTGGAQYIWVQGVVFMGL